MLSKAALLVHEVWYDHPESNSEHVRLAYSLSFLMAMLMSQFNMSKLYRNKHFNLDA